MIEAYPLKSIELEEAMEKQFKLVDTISQVFEGNEFLTRGDLGVVPGFNKPRTTKNVEKVVADYFGQEDAILVRGSGTNAIRLAIHSVLKPREKLLIHDAPIYSTTKTSIQMLDIETVTADFNKYSLVKKSVEATQPKAILIQLTRQQLSDKYDFELLIQKLKRDYPSLAIITDDNYAVMKVPNIGAECGADLSCFSSFKLLGPEGIGCIVGKKRYIDTLKRENYSGGSQVQGHEALDVLKGMVYAPVSLAISARESEKLAEQLNNRTIDDIKSATIVNAQSKVVIVEFEKPIASKVLELAPKHGAAPNPVGAESKYEIIPMIYRISGSFMEAYPEMAESCIRINPMRSSAETIIRIMKEVLREIE